MQPGFRFPVNQSYQRVDLYVAEYVTEIGRDSIRLRTRTELPVGTRIRFHHAILLDDLRFVSGSGTVAFSAPQQSGLGMLLHVEAWDAGSLAVLEMIERGVR